MPLCMNTDFISLSLSLVSNYQTRSCCPGSHVHVIFLSPASVRRGIQLGGVLTWGSQTELIMNMNCGTSSLPAPVTHLSPPRLKCTSCLRQAAHSLGCFRGNPDNRDGHTAYNPAPHLGYELAYQGLSTLVMGPMTVPHLGSRPCDLQGLQPTDSDCTERLVDQWKKGLISQ